MVPNATCLRHQVTPWPVVKNATYNGKHRDSKKGTASEQILAVAVSQVALQSVNNVWALPQAAGIFLSVYMKVVAIYSKIIY